jgi:hypothetical protein
MQISPEPIVCKPIPNQDGKTADINEQFQQFKAYMEFRDAWIENQLKMEKENAEETKTSRTWKERLYYNNLRTVYIGHEVTVADIDTMVNTMSLVCALVLTVPYGVLTAANKGT